MSTGTLLKSPGSTWDFRGSKKTAPKTLVIKSQKLAIVSLFKMVTSTTSVNWWSTITIPKHHWNRKNPVGYIPTAACFSASSLPKKEAGLKFTVKDRLRGHIFNPTSSVPGTIQADVEQNNVNFFHLFSYFFLLWISKFSLERPGITG